MSYISVPSGHTIPAVGDVDDHYTLNNNSITDNSENCIKYSKVIFYVKINILQLFT